MTTIGGSGTLTKGGLTISEPTDRLRQAVREALKQQDDEVDEREVQAYVLEALGVELSEEELIPIIDELIDEEDAARAAAAAAFREQNYAELIALGYIDEPGPPQDLPPECGYDETRKRKLEKRLLFHRSWADIYQERIDDMMKPNKWIEDQRQEFDGETRITANNHEWFLSEAPSLRDYRDKAMRTPDSLPARFYRMMMGKEWDGEGHSYSLARKKYRRFLDDYKQRERERQQRKKRDYSKKKRPADDNARRQARRRAQRGREKVAPPAED